MPPPRAAATIAGMSSPLLRTLLAGLAAVIAVAVVASGSKKVKGGDAAVKLRFTKKAKRAIEHARKVTVRIKVRFAGAGGIQRTSVSLTLKR
jgi:hypothetical protein